MNIFKEENLFLGKFSLERLNEADRQFWIVAKEVDNILGDRKYLLNFYLSFIFAAMNSTIAFEAAEEGFKNCTELLCLCGDVYNGTNIKERFMNVSLSDIYLQSTINQYIDCLMQRDPTTSKYIFRIILDSVKTRE